MTHRSADEPEQVLSIPARITYRLESDYSIVAREDVVLPVFVDDDILSGILKQALMTGQSYEEIVTPILTQAVAERLAHDPERQAHFSHIAAEHRTNILTEVSIRGQIVLPRTKAARS
jgi:hypothetical protein